MAKSAQEIVDLLVGFNASAPGSMDDILKDALQTLEMLWSSDQQAEVKDIAEKIADAARTDKWRIPIGETGVLDFLLDKVPDQGTGDSVVQTLRVIGNACVDCDENRDRVVASKKLLYLVSLLKEDNLIKFVVPAVFNVCVSCIPAQNQAYEAGFSTNIIDIIDSPRLEPVRGILGLMLKGLELLEASKNTTHSIRELPGAAVRLLNFITARESTLSLEEFTDCCTSLLAFLSYDEVQEALIREDKLHLLLNLLRCHLSRPVPPSDYYDEYFDAELIDEIRDQRSANYNTFAEIIANIALRPDAFTKYGPRTIVFDTLVNKWLRDFSQPQLQIVACLFIGNLACSDDHSVALAKEQPVLNGLADLVVQGVSLLGVSPTPSPGNIRPTSEPLQAVYQALSCLKNLSIPADNKRYVAATERLLESFLPKYWTAAALNQGVLPVALSLTRCLLTKCPENVEKIISPREDGKTIFQVFMEIWDVIEGRRAEWASDVVIAKNDVYRTVCAVFNVLFEPEDQDTKGNAYSFDVRVRFLQDHPKAAPFLGWMLEECKNDIMRAEVLFALHNMCKAAIKRPSALEHPAVRRTIATATLRALSSSPMTLVALADCIFGEGEGARLVESLARDEPIGHVPSNPDPEEVLLSDEDASLRLKRSSRELQIVISAWIVARIIVDRFPLLVDNIPQRDIFEGLVRLGGPKVRQC
ncbi:hypothetical protein V8F20_011238 [Naviculisporaceae sp. PSN 640]